MKQTILTKLLNLLQGYVSFSAEGGFSERFLNLCNRNNIVLWNLSVEANRITACTRAEHYRKIKPCAVRSGMLTKIVSRHGLPFFINKHRHRAGLLYGLIFGICFITLMSTMVWSINISGNNRITDEEILRVLAESGIKYGTFRKNVDAASARFHAIHSLHELSYMTVNVIGSSIEVTVSETSDAVPSIDKEYPCDVVSTVDGQIAALQVYQGTKLHSAGEAIRAGETLAAGFIELNDGSVKPKHAEAYALIRTDLSFKVTTNAQFQNLVLTDEETKTMLHFMCFNIPLYKEKSVQPAFTRHRQTIINKKVMPVGITQKIYRTYSAEIRKVEENKLMLCAAENYLTEKLKRLDGASICTQSISIQQDSGSITVSLQVLGEISAGVAKKTLTE